MLDTLAEAGAPPATTLDASIQAAASLAGAYLARKDRVGLIEYGGPFRWSVPAPDERSMKRLLEALLRADVVFSYVRGNVALVPRRVCRPRRSSSRSARCSTRTSRGCDRPRRARLRSRDPEPLADPARSGRDTAVAQRRPGVSAMGASTDSPSCRPAPPRLRFDWDPRESLEPPGGIHPIRRRSVAG